MPRGAGAFLYLCAHCAEHLEPIQGGYCRTCGAPLPQSDLPLSTCAYCRERPRAFDGGRTCGAMRGPLRALIHALKYRGMRRALADLTHLCSRTDGYFETLQSAVLVPIPLHPSRERERGYNQAALLADAFSKHLKDTPSRPLLRRTRKTPSQTQLDLPSRHENMREAFAPIPNPAVEKDRLHVLVDDVFTTGATLNAAAVALRRAGVKQIRVATLAHG